MNEQPDISQWNLTFRLSDEPSGKLLGPKRYPQIINKDLANSPAETGAETRAIICFDCGQISFVPEKAFSTQCKHCGAHMSLEDYTVTPATRRTLIKTQGQVTVPPDANLSGLTLMCKSLIMEGWVSGPIYCLGELHINSSGTFDTTVQAHTLYIGRKARVAFHRTLRVKSARIEGEVTGNIVSEGVIILSGDVVLMGDVVASRIELPLGTTHKGKFRPIFPGAEKS